MGWQDDPIVESQASGQPLWMSSPLADLALTPEPVASEADKIVGSPWARFGRGVVGLPLAGIQAGANLYEAAAHAAGRESDVGQRVNQALKSYEEAEQRGMKALGNEGTNWMGLLGSLASGGVMAKGVGMAMPWLTSLAGKEGGKAALARIGLGGVQGGAIAAGTPVTDTTHGFWEPKAEQIGMGAALGVAVPTVIEAARGVGGFLRDAAAPFFASGQARLKSQYDELLRGKDPALRQRFIDALQRQRTLVPGEQPTSAELLSEVPGSTGRAKWQEVVGRKEGLSAAYEQRMEANQDARKAAIAAIAKTPADRQAAVDARAAVTEPMRDDALAATEANGRAGYVDSGTLLRRIRGLASGPENRASETISSALNDIKGSIRDLSKDGAINAKSLYMIRKQIGTKIRKASEASKDFSQDMSAGLQRDVQGYIDDAIENSGGVGWRDYLTTYQEMSGPINRMDVGRGLAKALTSPTDKEQGERFAKAIQEEAKTLKRSTGFSRYTTLDEVLTPQEMESVNAVNASVQRLAEFHRRAPETTVQGGASEMPFHGQSLALPWFDWKMSLANKLMKAGGKIPAEDAIQQATFAESLDPALYLRALQTPQQAGVVDAMMRRAGVPLTVGATSTSARQF